MKRNGIIGILVIIVLAGSFIGYLFFRPTKLEPLPNPNGYDDFVAAGEMISGETSDGTDASANECRAFVLTNRLALEKGRSGLTKACRVPTEYSTTWLQSHTAQITATRKLARAFCVEGNLARLENRPRDAATSYMTAIKLGVGLVYGGLMIDGLIGSACEGQGEMCIARLIQDLDLEQSLRLIDEMQRVEADQEPCVQIVACEKRWGAAQLRSVAGLKMYIGEAINKHSLAPDKAAQDDFSAQYNARLKWTLQLKAKLAAHAYALVKGQLPTKWDDLVPSYLQGIPDVPFGPDDTNQLKFHESRTTDRWLF